jgi:heme/copper-type cytochrome/quinol oxidase subunit 3
MSDVALQQVPGVYEPSLFGTYSKKIGMWLFLLSDSLTFGALLYAYTYGRISTPNWPTPFHSESIRNATFMTAFLLTSSLTMVFCSALGGHGKPESATPVAVCHHGVRPGIRGAARP